MASTVSQTVPNTEEHKKVSGLNVFGYVVPWWVVILVLVVLLYVAYDNDLLKDVIGTKEIRMNVPNLNVGNSMDLQTPTQLKYFAH